MKMEQHEIFSHFEFEKDRWNVKLELDYSEAKVQLIIQVIDTLTARVSAAKWKVERLQADAEMKLIFPTLEELFYYLAHNSKSLQISEGAIEFVVSLGQAMKNRKFSFKIELSLKEMAKEDVNELRIRLLEMRFEKQMKLKDEQIKNLQRQVEVLNNRIGSNPNLVGSMDSSLVKESYVKKNKMISPHPGNPDNQCFNFTPGAYGLRVKRILVNNWVNFIAQKPITQPTVFKIKVWKLSNRCLCLGVGTKNLFGVHNYHEIQFPNYDFECRQIAIEQRKINAPSNIQNGSVLTLKCNTVNYRITWACDEQQIGTVNFPAQIRKQEIYLIAYFKNNGDQLQIWEE